MISKSLLTKTLIILYYFFFAIDSHSLESFTALPYSERTPRPRNPSERPAYQGSNPISDIWSLKALKICVDNLIPASEGNPKAQESMLLAATFAGNPF